MLIFSFSFSKSAQYQLLSWPLNSTLIEAKTGCANSVKAPTWDIQRRRDRLFNDMYRKKNGWETLTLLWRSRAADPWPFCACHIMRAVLREPEQVSWRTSGQPRSDRISWGNVTRKESATWESCVDCGAGHGTDVCVINTDGPWAYARDLSLVYQLFSETYTWTHDYLSYLQTCCSPHETVDLLPFHGCLLTSVCQDRCVYLIKISINNTQWIFLGHPYINLRSLFVRNQGSKVLLPHWVPD